MMLKFGAKLIKFRDIEGSYTQKVIYITVFSKKILYNATLKAHFSCIIFQLKQIL
jgi:hypothetical protein